MRAEPPVPARRPGGWPGRIRRLGLALAGLAVLAVLAWRLLAQGSAPAVAAAAAAPPPPPPPPQRAQFAAWAGAADPALPDERARRHRQLLENLQLADRTYCNYRNRSRYPAGARPMTENPDQDRPNDPVTSTNAMHQDGGGSDGSVQVQASQSRIYMAAGETVAFRLRAAGADGNALPLVVTRAVAQGITHAGMRQAPQVALPFADDGSGADAVANDGAFAAVLAPGQTGLAGFDGTIRAEVRYSVGGKGGVVQFDVIYTPGLPAVWAGPVREALEEGSLNYYLRLDVRQPGRYIVNGRVDDARGRPLALLTFNEVLGPGPNDVKLALFGKLLHDLAPAQPLTLRDVDGYLLKEDTDPDRALLPRLEGKVFSGKPHAVDGFADVEWQGEERSRYLAEFARDLQAARARLAAFEPAMALPPMTCLPVGR